MAANATIYKALLNIANMDSHYYRITSYNVCYTKLLRLVLGRIWNEFGNRTTHMQSGFGAVCEFETNQLVGRVTFVRVNSYTVV